MLPYPALGEWAEYEVVHPAGRARVAIKNLPKSMVVEEDGKPKTVIQLDVRLGAP